MPRKKTDDLELHERFPPLFVEALAYHEAGHVLMAVLFDAPIKHVVIAERCTVPNFNGQTVFDWESRKTPIPGIYYALISVGSEAAEKLAPNFDEFKTLHRKHRHLNSFAIGVRNDITHALCSMVHYQFMGLSESTARQYFKRDVREPAEQIIRMNAKNLIQLAEQLQEKRFIEGEEAREIILSAGQPTTGDVLSKYDC